jgi:hypothetical protein
LKLSYVELIDHIEYALAPMSVHLSSAGREQTQNTVLRECLEAFRALARQAQPDQERVEQRRAEMDASLDGDRERRKIIARLSNKKS